MTDMISDEAVKPVVDLEAIVPQPGEPFEIGAQSSKGGVLVQVNRLRTIEFLALMRAVARGVGPSLATLDFSEDEAAMQGELVGMLLMAVPEAADDFVAFVQKVTVPVGKSDAKRVAEELQNPEIEDLMAIVEVLALQEANDLRRLVGKAQVMWERVRTTYQKKT